MPLRGADYLQRAEQLCRILRSYRVLRGLTQQQLADELGMAQTMVSKIESRERRLDLIELEGYLAPLGRTVRDLLADMETTPLPEMPQPKPSRLARQGKSAYEDVIRITAPAAVQRDIETLIDVHLEADGVEVTVDLLNAIVGYVSEADDPSHHYAVDLSQVPEHSRDSIAAALRSDKRWTIE
ncbi:helix-turn-helix domain-containing protein [Gordonia tangerina]|uniref:Helix-turn-helix domain-containing protein n=1 Tax=Gordonia tangerina TaxID=2911060 RepID=A0ABS9DD93_9ACTN|nr:helix-turn-helix transcriptional regulator [Gordonia tangerina]MCF3937190.1 helix-turn-helix domain-containing protein [Gordonia tangerina]